MADPLVEAAASTGMPVVDLNDLICPGAGDCPGLIGHVIVYRDELSHLSDTYSASLAGALGDRLLDAFKSAGLTAT